MCCTPEKALDARSPPAGRVAGVDYGSVRIGLAVSDPDRTLASPYENYTRRGPEQDARRFQRLVAEESIRLFVVGLPVHTDGRESKKSLEVRRFADWLGETTGVPVRLFDERYTTVEAEAYLASAGMTKKRRKARLDMLAAQILLAAFLECQGNAAEPGPLEDAP